MNTITVKGKSFVDSYGRQRIFYGVNLCDKGTFNGVRNDYTYSYPDSMFEKLSGLGFNVIRLGITWDAVEPEKGRYNRKYLEAIRGILDQCERYGIYAYIDMHQDLYSGFNKGYSGDGAPLWACMMDKYKPKPTRFVWAEGYFFGRAIHRAFDSFWTNRRFPDGEGVQDCYIKMWQQVAETLGDHPALLGFDVMNEPFPGKDGGKIFRKLVLSVVRVTLTDKRLKKCKLISDLMKEDGVGHVLGNYTAEIFENIVSVAEPLVKKFDLERYNPFLNRTATAIREKTDKGILFMENSYYSNMGIPYSANPIEVKGQKEPQQAFSPHAYDLMVDTELYKFANNDRVGAIFAQRKKEQDTRLNMPVLVGEWGGFSEGTLWFPHVEYLLNLFDSNLWSSTYWAYFKELPDTPLMEVLHRPHPIAVTGEILSYRFNKAESTFTIEYNQDREYQKPTELYLHKKPTGVEADGEHSLAPIGDGYILSINTKTGKQEIRVTF